jgi:hypothetical protein
MLISPRRIGALSVLSALLAFGQTGYATSTRGDPPISVVPGDARGSIGIGVHNYPLPPKQGGNGGPGFEGVSADTGGVSGDICGDPTIICPAAVQAQKCGVINETFGYSGITDPARMNPILAANGCPTVGAAGVAPLPPTPGQLAQRAYGQLRLPAPTIERSPPATNSYNGVPFTWLNIWTWFWTSALSYAPVSKTESVPGVSATVVARPSVLVFDPGDGSAAVPCSGPGRAWTEADGDDRPPGGCGFMYRHTSDGSILTATVTIRWDVTWTGTGGAGGVFNGMTTQAAGPLQVLDVQVVNTGR